jgi:DNA-binding response OmpR family regulator
VQLPPPSLDQPFYRDEHLFVHLRHQIVMWDGQAFTLTRMQYRVLALLAEQAGGVVPRTQLRRPLSLPETHTRVLDVHIHGLRRKLGVYADHIETVTGIGYRFRPFLPRD